MQQVNGGDEITYENERKERTGDQSVYPARIEIEQVKRVCAEGAESSVFGIFLLRH